jgi:hypothetical protein
LAVQISTREWRDTVLWRPGVDAIDRPLTLAAGDIVSDARLLCWRDAARTEAGAESGVVAQLGGSFTRNTQSARAEARVLA